MVAAKTTETKPVGVHKYNIREGEFYQCAFVGLLPLCQSNMCIDQFRQFLYFRVGNV